MKPALKLILLLLVGIVFLAALHSHANEHQVPHPNAAKVSVAKHVIPQPPLGVVHVAADCPAAEHLIEAGQAVTPAYIVGLETNQSSNRLRGPPLRMLPR